MIIKRVWGENVSASQLQKYYKANDVKFYTAKKCYKYASLN